MISCNSIPSHSLSSRSCKRRDHFSLTRSEALIDEELPTRAATPQLWFFLAVAPIAVLTGWLIMAFCLTGNWTWELPTGLALANAGSMIALALSRLRS